MKEKNNINGSNALKILIAEDHLISQYLAVNLVEKLGHCAEVANNGLEVIEQLKQQSFDIILMDVEMPEMNGIETTKMIVESLGENHPFIVAVTANDDEAYEGYCEKAGMDFFAPKPLSEQKLLNVLDAYRQWKLSHPQEQKIMFKAAEPDIETMFPAVNFNSSELMDTITTMFVTQVPPIIESLNDSIEAEDEPLTKATAHKLKGMALSLGFEDMVGICQALMSEGAIHDKSFATSQVNQLRAIYENVAQVMEGANA